MPLTVAPLGREVKIIKVLAEEKTKRHLANIGLLAGEQITVLSSAPSCNRMKNATTITR